MAEVLLEPTLSSYPPMPTGAQRGRVAWLGHTARQSQSQDYPDSWVPSSVLPFSCS